MCKIDRKSGNFHSLQCIKSAPHPTPPKIQFIQDGQSWVLVDWMSIKENPLQLNSFEIWKDPKKMSKMVNIFHGIWRKNKNSFYIQNQILSWLASLKNWEYCTQNRLKSLTIIAIVTIAIVVLFVTAFVMWMHAESVHQHNGLANRPSHALQFFLYFLRSPE